MCVEHLNRCKTPTHWLQGVPGALMRPALTKTLISCLWYRWGRSSTYLQVFHFRSWRPAKPKTGLVFFMHGFRNLKLVTYFILRVWASVHFRIQCCTIDAFFRIWSLFYLSHLHLGYSDDYFEEDSLVSRTSLILHARDSVPHRSYDGSFFV